MEYLTFTIQMANLNLFSKQYQSAEDSEALWRLAVPFYRLKRYGFLIVLIFLLGSSLSLVEASSLYHPSSSKVLVQGNLLPIREVLKQSSLPYQTTKDWLSLIMATPILNESRDDASLSLSYGKTQGYQGETISVSIFEEEQRRYTVAQHILKLLNPQEGQQFEEHPVSYQTASVRRNGFELGVRIPPLLRVNTTISFRYWEVMHYQKTLFSGDVVTRNDETHLSGTLYRLDDSLKAFRKQPYLGHGLGVYLDLYYELFPGTTLFVNAFPLYAKDILQNVGVMEGVVNSDRKYLDTDSFINYGATIKGRYYYEDLKLPATDNSVYGIQHHIGERVQVQLSTNRIFGPELQLKFVTRDWQISCGYLYPSLHSLEITRSNIALGLYLGGTPRAGLTSFGVSISGGLPF